MNLLSAVAGALAVALTFGAVQGITRSHIAAIGAACALGASQAFWSQAIIGDKYAINACFVALLIFLLQRWLEQPNAYRLYALALAYGFSLTHHRSMLTLAPLLLLMVLWHGWSLIKQPRVIMATLVCLIAPLLLYLYLPFGANRPLQNSVWQPATLSDWIQFLLDRNFLSAVQPADSTLNKLMYYAQTLLAQFGWVGIALGIAGMFGLIARRRPIALVLIAWFVMQAVLTSGYEVFRNWLFFIPSFVVFAVFIGCGIDVLASLFKRESMQTSMAAAMAIALPALIFIPNFAQFRRDSLDGGAIDLYRNDLKHGYQAERFVASALEHALPNAVILADWEQATPLWYVQVVEGRRNDLDVIWPIELLSEKLLREAGKPVYIARTYPTLGAPYRFSADGPLIRASLQPNRVVPDDLTNAGLKWEDTIELIGYRLEPRTPANGRAVPISLYFKSLKPIPNDIAISLRLFNEAGEMVWQEDRSAFAMGMFPTSRWADGEVAGDFFEAELPANLRPGRYRFGLVLYAKEAGGFRNLKEETQQSELALLPFFEVSR
jgi:hypothetical protein